MRMGGVVCTQDPQPPRKQPAKSTDSDDAQDDETSLGYVVESVEASLGEMENDSGLDSSVKDLLRPKYKQALAALESATNYADRFKLYQSAIADAPSESESLKSQLLRLPTLESAQAEASRIASGLNSGEIQELLNLQFARVNSLNDELDKATTELDEIKLRPTETNDRLPKVEVELEKATKQLASPEMAPDATSAGRTADRVLLEATEIQLQNELDMLQQEQKSHVFRQQLLQAKTQLLARQLENASAKLKVLESLKKQTLRTETEQIGSDIDAIVKGVSETDVELLDLAKEIREMLTELEGVVKNQTSVSKALELVRQRLAGMTDEYEYASAQLELGGSGNVIAQLLFALRNQILRRGNNSDLIGELPNLDQARLDDLKINQKVRRQGEFNKKYSHRTDDRTQDLLRIRREVLTKFQSQQKTLVVSLSSIQVENERYQAKADSVLKFVYEQLFWIRSFSPVTISTLADLPGGIAWVFNPDHFRELWQVLLDAAKNAPMQLFGMLALIGILLGMRGRIITALEKTGLNIRRISTDQYKYTFQALMWTILLAAPIPLFCAVVWWVVDPVTESNDWLRGVGIGLSKAVWLTLLAFFIVAMCRPGGLGVAHFGWAPQTVKRVRTAVIGFTIIYVPALLVTYSTLLGPLSSQYGDNIGRVSFILAQIWTLVVVVHLFGTPNGILASLVKHQSDKLLTRTRYAWYAFVLLCPTTLVILAWRGYLITSIELSIGILATLAIVTTGYTLYWMSLRWFGLQMRKLALAAALSRRQARLEAAKTASDAAEPDEIVSLDSEEELEIDLESISDQTRHVLRMLFGLGVIVAIILFWSETIPVFSALEKVRMPLTKSLSLLSAGKAVLIMVVTWVAVQNLAGLLELSVLRSTTIEKGTRYAISKICQYVVTAIGLVMLFNVIQVDWTQFGWIAAALSVGLGFGLQEVVANSVCGLIVLFERPVRLGDVVTLDGMTGTVTNIQMRATTITNWDRQEFIVPNKNLITGTILNWTLSAAINRLVLPVGVAYGTDTEKAREILLSVAKNHPLILDDPAPSTNFEQFADSSLSIILRAYLPDLDNRLNTITELHTEINKRFNEEGIEIAFPQLDLHVRNSWKSELPGIE